ncbi:ZIP family metal transporter [Deinococcus budaensis]|uniref:ZIP family zinc transporter n=1 Tax=Deinococcus budaensis TaxID=1665626 RepID=A0A7W8LQX7_9DEIO|nr:ZIP family zinc transporter [Deinococcus budaensis]MBB5235055.1 ZIP family zinc transporter [Deinococcus budaensis]
MWTAAFWGLVAGASLLLGGLLGLYAPASRRVVALIMALGSGVLVSSVAFDLMDEAYGAAGLDAAAGGLLLGAAAFFLGDLAINRAGGLHRKRSGGQQAQGSAPAIVLGTLMDGIPESVAIGVSLLAGGKVGWVFVAAVFLSNIPESLSASVGLKRAGHAPRQILLLWTAIALASAAAAGLGFALLRGADPNLTSGIQAFAAGAILTMLSSTMLPEAFEEGGPAIGLATTVGFLLAFSLRHLG